VILVSEADQFTPEMVERIEELQDDESVDSRNTNRHEDGWVRFYVECPDCHVPMARTTVEAKDVDETHSRSTHRCICPECHAVQTNLTVYRETYNFDEKHRRSDE